MHTANGIRLFQTMVPMRDGTRLNTFVYLPLTGGPRFPVILQRTPYGITASGSTAHTDCMQGWLPDAAAPMRGSMLRGYKQIVARGYVAVYQDARGRYASEGEDRVYADDAADGYDTLEWIASQPWCNRMIGMSGSSAGATTTFAAASQRHPSLRAFFAQVGGSSIYDDVVYEGNAIEMERLWLWVAKNIPGLSPSHRAAAMRKFGISAADMGQAAIAADARYARLDAARHMKPPFVASDDWMRLPLARYPDFSTWQPFLDEILAHPAPDAFRAQHNFRRSIEIPGFHATTWYDIFQTSVITAFNDIQSRVGNQLLWIGPNEHYFIYESHFWPRDPYFEWFDYWLKGEPTGIMERPAVFYSPRAWVEDQSAYVANDWRYAERWPPPDAAPQRFYLCGDGSLSASAPGDSTRSFIYDPRRPIPTLGGRNMLIDAGPRDQRPAQALPDYGLIYRSEILDADLTIAGQVRVTLHVQSDCPDTDFVAKLIEVEADGRAMLLMDGVVRAMYRDLSSPAPQPLAAGQVYPLTISLAHIHHTIRAGNRIEIDITSSNFPRRARNTNSGNPMLANDSDADMRVATNTVHHGEATPSFIEIPVLTDITPTGKLRVGINGSNATLFARAADGSAGGIAVELGKFIAERLGVPFEPVVYAGAAAYTASFGKGEWDIIITGRNPLAAQRVEFMPDVILIDYVYLAAPGCAIVDPAQVDQAGVRIGVPRNASADAFLTQRLKSAELVRLAGDAKTATEMLRDGRIDLYASGSDSLQKIASGLPGSKVIGTFETVAFAVSTARGWSLAAKSKLTHLVNAAKAAGIVQAAIEKSGSKGVRAAPA